jgi:hypothetical protein
MWKALSPHSNPSLIKGAFSNGAVQVCSERVTCQTKPPQMVQAQRGRMALCGERASGPLLPHMRSADPLSIVYGARACDAASSIRAATSFGLET